MLPDYAITGIPEQNPPRFPWVIEVNRPLPSFCAFWYFEPFAIPFSHPRAHSFIYLCRISVWPVVFRLTVYAGKIGSRCWGNEKSWENCKGGMVTTTTLPFCLLTKSRSYNLITNLFLLKVLDLAGKSVFEGIVHFCIDMGHHVSTLSCG